MTLTGFTQIENFACAAFVKQQINEKRTARGYQEVNRATGGGVDRAGNQAMKVIPLRSRVQQAKGSVERSYLGRVL